MTHLTSQTNTIYVNDGTALFDGPERRVRTRPGQLRLYRLRNRLVRLRQRRVARRAGSQRHGAGRRPEPRRALPVRTAQPVVPQSRQRAFRRRDGSRRRPVRIVGGEPRSGLRRHRQRRRRGRARRQRQRPGSAARQPDRQRPSLDRTATRRDRVPRHARRAGRDCPRRRADPLAAGAERRQLRVGQRPARARRARRRGGGARRVRVHWPGWNAAEEWPRMAVDRWTTLVARERRREAQYRSSTSRICRRRLRAAAVLACRLHDARGRSHVRRALHLRDAGGRTGADAARLPAVALPDLSNVESSIRTQLQEEYAALTIGNRSTRTPPPSISVTPTAEMGHLLMATRHREAAEICYLHARTLAPGERRWPYYLGHVSRTCRCVLAFRDVLRTEALELATA